MKAALLVLISLALIGSAFAYSYNDTTANDSTLILTASQEVYAKSSDGNYIIYVELENESAITAYSDIDLEIYIEKEHSSNFIITEIYREQSVYGPVPFLADVNCSKITEQIDLNLSVTYICEENERICQNDKVCTWKEIQYGDEWHIGWGDYSPAPQLSAASDPEISNEFESFKEYQNFSVSANSSEKFKLIVSPKIEITENIEFIVVAKSRATPEVKSILDPAFGPKITIWDMESGQEVWAGAANALDCIAGDVNFTEGTYSANCGGVYTGDYEQQWTGQNMWGAGVDISNETGESSGPPSRGEVSIDWYIPDIDNIANSPIKFYLGNANNVYCQYDFVKADFSEGWNTVKIDLSSPDDTQGTPDWTNTGYFSALFYLAVGDMNFSFDNLYAGETKAIDINIFQPQNNEIFDKKNYSTIDINFYISSDYNTALIDLNYSESQEQGTGIAIITDMNTTGEDIVCEDNDFSDSTFCSYPWDITAVNDGNYYILEDANTQTGETDFNAGARDFNIYTSDSYTLTAKIEISGPGILDPENGTSSINMPVYDLSACVDCITNTWQWLVDGVEKSTDQNTTIVFNSPGDYNLTLRASGTASTYDENSINIDVNQFPQDLNFITDPAEPGVNADTDLNGNATDDGTITDWTWGFHDGNAIDQNTTIQFTSPGVKNICLTVTDDDDLNKMECGSLSVYGSLIMRFVDENSLAARVPTTLTFNGADYTSYLSGNVLELSLVDITTGTYEIIASDLNHSARHWIFDLNYMSEIDINAALLRDSYGGDINFQFYGPDEITLLPSARIKVLIGANMVAEIRETDSDGRVTFFLNNTDYNYSFDINTNDGNTYLYTEALVTIEIPKNENDMNIVIPFSVGVGGLGNFDFNNMTTAVEFWAFTNTLDYYRIQVDGNASYYPRRYYLSIQGDTNSYSLQPYLVDGTSGILSILYVKDLYSRESLPGIFIESVKTIFGVGSVIVESQTTDAAGTVALSFIALDSYLLNFYEDGNLIYTANITPNSTGYDVWLEREETEISYPQEINYDINFTPNNNFSLVPDTNGLFILGETIGSSTGSISNIRIIITNPDLNILDVNYSGVPNGATYSHDLNSQLLNLTYPVTTQVIVTLSSGEQITRINTWRILSGTTNLKENLTTVKNEYLGEFGGIIIAILATLAVIGLAVGMGLRNLEILGMLAAIVLGIFVFIGWVPVLAYGLAMVAGLGAYILKSRVGT